MKYSTAKRIEQSAPGLVIILIGVVFAFTNHYYRGYLQMSQGILDILNIFTNYSTWFTMGITLIILQFFFGDNIKKKDVPPPQDGALQVQKEPNIKLSMIVFCLILLGAGATLLIDANAPTWKTYSRYQVSFEYYHSMVLKEDTVNERLFSNDYGLVRASNSSIDFGLAWSKNPSFSADQAINQVTENWRSQFDSVEIIDSYTRVVSGFQANCQNYLITNKNVKMFNSVAFWYDSNGQIAYSFIGIRFESFSADGYTHVLDTIRVVPMQST